MPFQFNERLLTDLLRSHTGSSRVRSAKCRCVKTLLRLQTQFITTQSSCSLYSITHTIPINRMCLVCPFIFCWCRCHNNKVMRNIIAQRSQPNQKSRHEASVLVREHVAVHHYLPRKGVCLHVCMAKANKDVR